MCWPPPWQTAATVSMYTCQGHSCRGLLHLRSNPRQAWSPGGSFSLDHREANASGNMLSSPPQVGKLDVLLTYLWRVHGVDYYGGGEVAEPEEEQRTGPRPTLRCQRPEEGEQPAEGAEKEQVRVFWRRGSPHLTGGNSAILRMPACLSLGQRLSCL